MLQDGLISKYEYTLKDRAKIGRYGAKMAQPRLLVTSLSF